MSATILPKKGAPFAINEVCKQMVYDIKAMTITGGRNSGTTCTGRRDELRDPVITQAETADLAQGQLPGPQSIPLLITSKGAAALPEQLDCEKCRLEKRINS